MKTSKLLEKYFKELLWFENVSYHEVSHDNLKRHENKLDYYRDLINKRFPAPQEVTECESKTEN